MNILVVNTGSSSIKYQIFKMPEQSVLVTGLLERIGEEAAQLTHHVLKGDAVENSLQQAYGQLDHASGIALIVALLCDVDSGVLDGETTLDAIGHRVVHGGEAFKEPAQIDDNVVAAIRKSIPLAPLHNPANLAGIEQMLALFPTTRQVAVFDTAFHQTMPAKAYRYALPAALYQAHGIRRYGFHGTSHAYVAKAAARYLARPLAELNLITLHLGNGASITAIAQGKSVETSMGLTPIEGLVMGTRCGDVDPAIPLWMIEHLGMSMAAVDQMLNKESGLKGICGSNDMRDILARKDAGDEDAALAVAIYCHRIRKYIGAYMATLGKVDALVFTGGIGENASEIRRIICMQMERMGIYLDHEANNVVQNNLSSTQPLPIHKADSPLKLLVARTNEEVEIAEQTMVCIME